MLIYKRFGFVFGLLILAATFLALRSSSSIKSSRIWREMPQKVGLGDWITDEEDEYKPELDALQHTSFNSTSFSDASSAVVMADDQGPSVLGPSKFKPGAAKPPGTIYTKSLVMGKMTWEDTSWLDQAALPREVTPYIYGVDDASGTLKVPQNKGREVMVYLSYIIDHYDQLPDVSIFVHAHQLAWHNSELLNHNATEMIKRLSSERVMREGYMNLRCSWVPGCPAWINPGTVLANKDRPEEIAMAETWAYLFPGEPIPGAIASACCAQFAISRDRIQSIPLQQFERYRTWLLKTSLPDSISGRVFEYLWAKIFTDQAEFCPDQRICYCDGYGICFEDEKRFDYWFELLFKQREARKELVRWREQAEWLHKERHDWGSLELKNVVIPPVDEDLRLEAEIDRYGKEMEVMRLEALRKGIDPAVRARVAGRSWKEGDGY